jgi:phosphinothricin acetyltransferase
MGGISTIRPATPSDAAAIAAIYNEALEERQCTFETAPRTPADFAAPIRDGTLHVVATNGSGDTIGWARLGDYSGRACYSGVGEASVYVDRACRGRGIGRALFDALAAEAERRDYWKLIGLLFAANEASVALCRAVGCREVGVLERHGRLDTEWRDVVMVEKLLGPAAEDAAGPAPPAPG